MDALMLARLRFATTTSILTLGPVAVLVLVALSAAPALALPVVLVH